MGIADRDYMRKRSVHWDDKGGERRLGDGGGAGLTGSGGRAGLLIASLVVVGLAGAGLWRYRHASKATPAAQPVAALEKKSNAPVGGPCLIKGNISHNGKLYHVPGSASYESTKIDESRGERWFCTEAEAEAAGWTQPQ